MNLKRSNVMKKICFLICFLICVSGFGKTGEDTLLSRNTLRFDIVGKAFGGIGIVFERDLANKHSEKHPNAFTSAEIGISDPYLFYDFNLMPGLGINRNWYLFKRKRFIADVGIYAAVKIDFSPSRKEIRDYYKGWSSIPGYIEYPFVPYLIGDFGLKMLFEQWFIKLSLNPMIYYEQIYAHRLSAIPWAGISFGFRFKK
jgi:hypothetical protein